MQKTITRIQQRRNAAATAMHQVLTALELTEEQYCYAMYHAGLTYLEHYIRNEADIKRFERNRIFWNWWKIQWTIREEDFMTYALKHDISFRYFLWGKLHDPLVLAQERTPNGTALGDSWSVMIGRMRKAQVDDIAWAEAQLSAIFARKDGE